MAYEITGSKIILLACAHAHIIKFVDNLGDGNVLEHVLFLAPISHIS